METQVVLAAAVVVDSLVTVALVVLVLLDKVMLVAREMNFHILLEVVELVLLLLMLFTMLPLLEELDNFSMGLTTLVVAVEVKVEQVV
jgi:hypothetical protein